MFWGCEEDSELAGVMGIQDVLDVTLIRHAYVRTARRNQGIGGKLLAELLRRRRARCWSAPGRRPSGRSASTSGTASAWSHPQRRTGCCGNTGRSRTARSRPPWCWRTSGGGRGKRQRRRRSLMSDDSSLAVESPPTPKDRAEGAPAAQNRRSSRPTLWSCSTTRNTPSSTSSRP